jgi:hypothetical protein
VVTHISGSVVVDCTSGEAALHLGDFFDAHADPDGADGARLTLCAPVGDATLSRDVVAELTRSHAYPGHRSMHVSWRPKGGGPYPHFAGTLSLGDEPAGTRITIDGAYEPPGGVAGAAFDVVLGRRMASASLDALLATLKAAIESARAAATASAAAYLPSYE